VACQGVFVVEWDEELEAEFLLDQVDKCGGHGRLADEAAAPVYRCGIWPGIAVVESKSSATGASVESKAIT